MKKSYSFPSLIPAFPKLFFLITIVFVLPIKAQIYTPSGTIQGTSGTNNVGIGTANPIGKLEVVTGGPGITYDVASQSNGSVSFANFSSSLTAPVISGKSTNNSGLVLMASSNASNSNADMRFDIRENDNSPFTDLTPIGFRFQHFGTSLIDILRNGNVGIGTSNPKNKLQIGEFNTSNTSKLSIPGVYNFEEIKLGQYGNGKNGLEMISHTNSTQSFGVRFYSGVDTGTNGLLIQTADPANSAGELAYTSKMVVTLNGNVGIGVTNPNNKLDVNGTIHSKEVKVDLNFPADYVFEKYYVGQSSLQPDYKLLTLSEVEKFTKENHHLPNVPSAKEIQENGLHVGEMTNALLQKIEELTLYMIEMKKENEEMKKEIELLKDKN